MTDTAIESIVLSENKANRRLLIAFAHPDDESFGPGGTIIHYANRGVAVHYVCGTRGEAGVVDETLLAGYDSIGALRTQELYCAAKHLGLTGLHFLNYQDSGMENSPANQNPHCLMQAPLEAVAEKITYLIRQIKPQVVLTFDPHGGYFHPDHIHMHRATVMAFHAAADPTQYPHQLGPHPPQLQPHQPQKLYYTVFSRGFIKVMVKLLPLFGQDPAAFGHNKDINLERIAAIKMAITTRIKVSPYFETSRQAANCHVSQLANGPARFPRWLRQWLSRYDTFTRVVPPFPDNGRLETDFFTNVDDLFKGERDQ